LSVAVIEKPDREFVSSFLKPGMTALDVGAHHGLYTTLMSKLVGPTGRVIAFEPSQRERLGLERHLRLNGCRNVRVEPHAIGSSVGQAEFFVVDGDQSGANSLRMPVLDGRTISTHSVSVPVTTIDQYLMDHDIEHVDFIKMDIEGAELEAFNGAEGLLTGKDRPPLMTEMSDMVTKSWGYHSREKYDLLSRWEYDWYSILPDGRLLPSPRRETYEGVDNFVAFPRNANSSLRTDASNTTSSASGHN